MTYTTIDTSIEKLFIQNQSYLVPRYQRGYVWGEKHWEDLMRDILTSYRNEVDYSHFLGTFVFEDVMNQGSNDIDYRYIIDGQQRLTTIQLIIYALIYSMKLYIQENLKTIKNKEFHDLKTRIELLQRYIYYKDLITTNSKMKLNNGLDNFNKLASLSISTIEKKDDIKTYEYLELTNDSISKAFWYIVEYIKVNVVGTNVFINSIIEFQTAFLSLNIITVSSKNQNEVLNLFEVLNARGLYLKQTELLKNFIFRCLLPGVIRDDVKIEWERMNDCFYDNNVDPDDYLFHFMRSYYGVSGLKKDVIYKSLKEEELKYKNTKVHVLYQNLKNFYHYYINIAIGAGSTNIERNVYEYFRLKQNKQIRSLLLSLKIKYFDGKITERQYDKFLTDILNYFIGFNIARKSSNQIDTYVSECSHSVFLSESFASVNYSILKFFDKISIYYPPTTLLSSKLQEIRYSNKNKRGNIKNNLLVYYLKPFYEKAKIEHDIEIPYDKINIEHVIPDNAAMEKTWEIGNLLLLTRKFNSDLKNKGYNEKRAQFLDSDLSYNREFARKYDNFTETEVTSRTSDIVQTIVDNCKFDINKIKSEYRLESKLLDVRKFIELELGNNAEARDRLEMMGVLSFNVYISRNVNFSEEIKSKFINILN